MGYWFRIVTLVGLHVVLVSTTLLGQVTFVVINNGTGTNNSYNDISWQAGPINAPGWSSLYNFAPTPIPPGGSEQYTFSWNALPGAGGGSGWQPYYFAIYDAALGVQTQLQSWDTYAGQSSPVTYIFYMVGTNVPVCTTNLTWNIQNGSTSIQTYIAANYPLLTPAQANADVPEPGGDTSGLLELDPGQSGLLQVPDVKCTNASAWQVYLVQSFEAANSGSNGTAVTYPLGIPAPGIGAPSGSSGSASPTSTSPVQTTPQQVNLPNGTGQYNPTNAAVSGTNAPILFTSTNTTVIEQQGDQALYTAVVNDGVQAHQDALTALGTNLLLGSRLYGAVTNLGGLSAGTNSSLGFTNTYAFSNVQLSNGLAGLPAMIAAATNAIGNPYGSLLDSLSGLPYNSPAVDSPGSAPEQDIDLGNGIVIPFGTAMPSYPGIRALIAWCLIVGVLLWNWSALYRGVTDAFKANQTHTAGTTVLGTSVSAVAALAMATFIIALVLLIPAVIVSALVGDISLAVAQGSPLSLLEGMGFGFSFINQYIPIVTLISCVCTRVVGTITVQATSLAVQAIKSFAVGL